MCFAQHDYIILLHNPRRSTQCFHIRRINKFQPAPDNVWIYRHHIKNIRIASGLWMNLSDGCNMGSYAREPAERFHGVNRRLPVIQSVPVPHAFTSGHHPPLHSSRPRTMEQIIRYIRTLLFFFKWFYSESGFWLKKGRWKFCLSFSFLEDTLVPLNINNNNTSLQS